MSTCKRKRFDLYLTPYPKINSHWITNLNVGTEIIKHLKKSIGVNLCELGLGTNDTKSTNDGRKNRKSGLH